MFKTGYNGIVSKMVHFVFRPCQMNEDNIFSNCFEQLSLAWQFVSISSPSGVSLNTSNQDYSEKMMRTTPDCAI